METSSQIWALLTLLSVMAFPQLLGVLLFFRLVRFSRWPAFTFGTLAPPLLFFFLLGLIASASFRAAEAKGPVPCGNAAVAVGFMILMGTTIHLVCAFGVHLYLFRKTGK
jgi:hypothetical protein